MGIAQREAGGSSYLLMEIQRIDDIITTLDEFWLFISRHSTGNFEQLVENDAALLMEELKRSLPLGASRGNGTEQESNPTPQNTPLAREVNQSGDKAIYIETNTGTITIN